MKAGLVADMVHVPATWATWRVHAQQSSASNQSGTIEHFNQVEEMIGDAVSECLMRLPAAVAASLESHFLEETKDMRVYYHTLRRLGDDVASRRAFQLAQVFAGKMAVRREILGRIIGRAKWSDSAPMEIRSWLEKLGLQPITALFRSRRRASDLFEFVIGLNGRARQDRGLRRTSSVRRTPANAARRARPSADAAALLEHRLTAARRSPGETGHGFSQSSRR